VEDEGFTFEAFGVQLAIWCDDPALRDQIAPILPPGWRQVSGGRPGSRFRLVRDEERVDLIVDGMPVARAVEPRVAIGVLGARIRAAVASQVTDWVFIHAGVVALGDRAVVIPGRTFSGKTTLVRALIQRGATYFSDEYAVLDEDGLVHPYPKPLSIRSGGREATDTSPTDLGASVGATAARVRVIAQTSYSPQAHWQPSSGTPADGALALFSHSVLAREQPHKVMSAVSRAAQEARLLEGERGEAEEVAPALLDAILEESGA
jgi:hypothetical protein